MAKLVGTPVIKYLKQRQDVEITPIFNILYGIHRKTMLRVKSEKSALSEHSNYS